MDDTENFNPVDKNEVVTDKMLRDFALSKRSEYMKVSAKKNQGIDEVFQRLGEKLIQEMPSVSGLFLAHKRQ